MPPQQAKPRPLYATFMNRTVIIILLSLAANVSRSQTQQQVDSLKDEIIKAIQKLPPIPDSVLNQSYNRQKARLDKIKSMQPAPDSLIFSSVKKYKVQVLPKIFETAFFEGTTMTQDSLKIRFYSVDIGMLNVESGKLIACDPIVMNDAKPFVQTFPSGKFPVQLSIAKIRDDERVAFSRIYFSDKPVVRWEFALDSGMKQIPIDGVYGYGVDGGIGLFIDAKANNEFTRLSKSDDELWSTVFVDLMEKNYRNTWQYILYSFQGHNLASFSTGYGDGHFGTYVGYDNDGQPCRLLTDFGLVGWWKK